MSADFFISKYRELDLDSFDHSRLSEFITEIREMEDELGEGRIRKLGSRFTEQGARGYEWSRDIDRALFMFEIGHKSHGRDLLNGMLAGGVECASKLECIKSAQWACAMLSERVPLWFTAERANYHARISYDESPNHKDPNVKRVKRADNLEEWQTMVSADDAFRKSLEWRSTAWAIKEWASDLTQPTWAEKYGGE